MHDGVKVKLQSRWELRAYKRFHAQGLQFRPQPKPAIPYRDQMGIRRTYTPDFLIYRRGQKPFYVEIKPSRFVSERLMDKVRKCEQRSGLEIQVWTEIEYPWLARDDLGGVHLDPKKFRS